MLVISLQLPNSSFTQRLNITSNRFKTSKDSLIAMTDESVGFGFNIPCQIPYRCSKDGCKTCRRRKKKCDEIHPTCGGCTRNSLSCQWSDHDANQPIARRRRRLCQSEVWPRSLDIPRELGGMVTVFAVTSRPILRRLLAHFTECSTLWMSISPHRHKRFLHHVVSTAVGSSLTMSCVLAVSAADLLKYETQEPELRMISLDLYGKAVAEVRSKINNELAGEQNRHLSGMQYNHRPLHSLAKQFSDRRQMILCLPYYYYACMRCDQHSLSKSRTNFLH